MKKNNEITIRSSAAEYLTYVAATGSNNESIEMHSFMSMILQRTQKSVNQ